MAYIYIDENNSCKFDFSSATWATDKLNDTFHQANTLLSDVDFVVEQYNKNDILLIEYKNASLPDATSPDAFNPVEDNRINKIIKKYYDSILFLQAAGRISGKRKIYVYLVEWPKGDVYLRQRICERLRARLPFKLQEQNNFKENLIDEVYVFNIEEWNKKFRDFQVSLLPSRNNEVVQQGT